LLSLDVTYVATYARIFIEFWLSVGTILLQEVDVRIWNNRE